MTCLNCGAELQILPKKRIKIFCNSTCRSNYWQRVKKLEERGFNADEVIQRIKQTKKRTEKQTNKPQGSTETKKSTTATGNERTEPIEGSNAFFLKHGVFYRKDLKQ